MTVPTEEDVPTQFFVRALFDFNGSDASSLSFKKGDIIEVLNTLASGWWDGLLNDERGWFPRNYVQTISDQEAEEEFNLRENANVPQQLTHSSHDPHERERGRSVDEEANWINVTHQNGLPNNTAPNGNTNGASYEYWLPQVSDDGRIFYVNTRTGSHSQFLPNDPDAAAPAQADPMPTRQRSATNASNISAHAPTSAGTTAGFGIAQRSGTPEPWVKRLADDGMTYYYVNTQTGQSRWSPPSPDINATRRAPLSADEQPTHPDISRARILPDADQALQNRTKNRTSIYSDDSDVAPMIPGGTTTKHPRKQSVDQGYVVVRPLPKPGHANNENITANPLQVALTLQKDLAPLVPPSLTSYSDLARDAINAVVEAFVDSNARASEPQMDDEEVAVRSVEMSNRVALVVVAVRNLLYVSGTLTGPLPNISNPQMGEEVEWARSEIKPYQRKVTATLSKLVLSARAVNANPDWPSNSSSSRVESDAAELERAVTTFVYQIQRARATARAKRLQGVFLPGEGSAGVGPGLIGAGAAGNWKGSGFIPLLERVIPPQRVLGREVLSELSNLRIQAEEAITALSTAISQYKSAIGRTAFDSRLGERAILAGRLAVGKLSEFLGMAEDVNIAGYIDVMGEDTDGDSYLQSVQRARQLIRTFETARQALYDDTTVVLMSSQAIHVSLLSFNKQGPADVVQAAIPAIRANLGTSTEMLELLLEISQDQTDALQNGRTTSYPLMSDSAAIDLDVMDSEMVSMVYAFNPESYTSPVDRHGFRPLEEPPPTATPSKQVPPHAGPSTDRSTPSMRSETTLNGAPSISGDTITPSLVSASVDKKPDDSKTMDEELEEWDDEFEPRKKPTNDKAAKILGSIPQGYSEAQREKVMPWYLKPDHTSPTEIVKNPDGSIRAATLPALVERLTMHDNSDAKFNDAFLLTFKSFSSVEDVFDKLVERFYIKAPDGLTPEQLDQWTKKKKTPVRLRSINTIRKLMETLEKEDFQILARAKAFANTVIANNEDLSPAAKTLLNVIQRVDSSGFGDVRTMHPITSDFPPPSILPRRGGKIKLLDIDPLELARQLTIMESELFFKIKPNECIARSREQTPTGPDNIKNVITVTNKMADWVADSVLSREEPKRRAAVIKHFISVAEKCRNLKNYSTTAALIAGLNCPPIRRLKRTWEQLSARHTTMLDDLEKTLDTPHSFARYKAMLSREQPPCVPFLGVYLTVLTFIQDGARDNLKDGGLINFQKRQKIADVILEITKFQQQQYNLTKIPAIRVFIDDCLSSLNVTPNFWDISLEREPREREDEKMARLLQESGFL